MARLLSNGPRATLIAARSKLVEVFCARVDAAGEDAHLETDKPGDTPGRGARHGLPCNKRQNSEGES